MLPHFRLCNLNMTQSYRSHMMMDCRALRELSFELAGVGSVGTLSFNTWHHLRTLDLGHHMISKLSFRVDQIVQKLILRIYSLPWNRETILHFSKHVKCLVLHYSQLHNILSLPYLLPVIFKRIEFLTPGWEPILLTYGIELNKVDRHEGK